MKRTSPIIIAASAFILTMPSAIVYASTSDPEMIPPIE